MGLNALGPSYMDENGHVIRVMTELDPFPKSRLYHPCLKIMTELGINEFSLNRVLHYFQRVQVSLFRRILVLSKIRKLEIGQHVLIWAEINRVLPCSTRTGNWATVSNSRGNFNDLLSRAAFI